MKEAASHVLELNAQQRAAVEHGEGPLLVVAGAGTGKTRVITERIRYLLETRADLAADNIAALTFTDKAAGEMLWRVKKAVGEERAQGLSISTFHSFCMEKILREGNPEIVVLDPIDHWILLRRNLARLGLQRFGKLSAPGQYLKDFQDFFSRCQDELVSAEDYAEYVESLRQKCEARKDSLEPDARDEEEERIADQEELLRAYRVSEELLRERNAVTFGGQLEKAVRRLENDPEILRRLRERFRFVLVDEFQDTNIAQIELLWLLAGAHKNIFAVGDDDQAIYRFRGASYGSFTKFLERFCGITAAEKDAKRVTRHLVELKQNYRSTQRIIRIARQVISHNEKSRLLPEKNPTTENLEGDAIRVAEFARPEEEAYWVADEIERLHGAGAKWESFAVLYRKHTNRDEIVRVLRERQIPFVIRKLSILHNTLIRDLLAYLRLIATPSDNVPCARVLAMPYWKFTPANLVRLAEHAQKKMSLWETLEKEKEEAWMKKSGARAKELVDFIDGFRKKSKFTPLVTLFEELREALGVAPLASDADRGVLERFAKFLEDWQQKSEGKTLRDFIEYFDYFLEAGGAIQLEDEQAPADDAVQLMTVHAAKGLEFPHVFVIRVSKGDFPSGARRPLFEFPRELMKEELPEGDFQIQEERRLFYVALTRARRQLTLATVVNKRKKESPFLEDFLREQKAGRADVKQISPSVQIPAREEATGSAPANAARPTLFGAAAENSKVYSQIALWARAYHPPQAEPLALSDSTIETYLSCPMKYMLSSLWHIRGGPQAAMIFGSVMHRTIAEFVKGMKSRGKMAWKEVAAIYEREWPAAGFDDAFQEEEYRKAGLEQLGSFYKSYIAAPADILYQEKQFELALDHDVRVTGRIDQINRLGPKEIEIVDYKTGSPKDAKAADKSLQLGIYAIAARESLEKEPARLVFYNLQTNEAVASTRDAKSLQKTKETVASVADRIRAKEFPTEEGFICKWCDYRPICPAHEQLVTIRLTLA
ncbi:MAG: ATP-dependent helicase [Candidatus Acidiferrales bacterium]